MPNKILVSIFCNNVQFTIQKMTVNHKFHWIPSKLHWSKWLRCYRHSSPWLWRQLRWLNTALSSGSQPVPGAPSAGHWLQSTRSLRGCLAASPSSSWRKSLWKNQTSKDQNFNLSVIRKPLNLHINNGDE